MCFEETIDKPLSKNFKIAIHRSVLMVVRDGSFNGILHFFLSLLERKKRKITFSEGHMRATTDCIAPS